MADPVAELRKTLYGVVLSTKKEGPIIDVPIEEDDGTIRTVVLKFYSTMPLAAMAALLAASNPTQGVRGYLEEAILPESAQDLQDILEVATFEGINQMMEALGEMYSGNSSPTSKSSPS